MATNIDESSPERSQKLSTKPNYFSPYRINQQRPIFASPRVASGGKILEKGVKSPKVMKKSDKKSPNRVIASPAKKPLKNQI